MQLRSRKGALLAEGVAAMAILLPILIVVLFVAIEASHAYLIKSSLSEAAREASRGLAVEYGKNPAIATDRSMQDSRVFDRVRIYNMVADSAQFDNPVFKTTADPPTVEVRVKYTGGQYGLPPFPNPDPLNMGDSLIIAGHAGYRLVGM
jgi:Flp pilus assembly protein TadG